jgi:ATP-dependent RNA helicase DHX29
MAGGNKKKRKPVANPARGFATTSIQSKSKVETAKGNDTADTSEAATTAATQTPDIHDDTNTQQTEHTSREIHELSPEELEVQLETAELQQFVEKHAAKVKREASRQLSRLHTDRRLMRGHAEFLSTKNWLPEELMQLIFDNTSPYVDHEHTPVSASALPLGEELIAKVWTLRNVLLDLIPVDRVNQTIGFLLANPPTESAGNQIWGLEEASDWLAFHCEPSELADYETTKTAMAASDNLSDQDEEDDVTNHSVKHDSPQSFTEEHGAPVPYGIEQDFSVSDIDSDIEPDELLSVYVGTKARLYELDPSLEEADQRKRSGRGQKSGPTSNLFHGKGVSKLLQRLDKIEGDALFDRREAESRWSSRKVEFLRASAERKKLGLQLREASTSQDVMEKAEEAGLANTQDGSEDADVENFMAGIFNALPGVAEPEPNTTENGNQQDTVTIRDFGKVTGMSPRRVLEEACRARDSRCKIEYRQVSPTTYACRYRVTITWSKGQMVEDPSYLRALDVRIKWQQIVVTMLREATPDTSQSEAYIATATLFAIFSGSPKEEKAHLRLPPAFRDLWTEFAELKRAHNDAKDRVTVRELRDLVEGSSNVEDEAEDEIVYKVSNKRLNRATSGASTPSRPLTPAPKGSEDVQFLKDLWHRKASTASYQRMLLARMNLPMFQAKADALDMIEKHQVTIVVGDTGSGKSTQVPQFILEHELSQGRQCKIYCTEPRRISALSLAQRVSEELGESKGDVGTHRSLVGYAIRLESSVAAQTRLVYATVGIVLRMLENEDGLRDITHLILDEVHERSIDTDFLLIILKSLRDNRPDLKVVLMSATVDAQKFSSYLDNAPIISVPGRTYPVGAKFLEDAIELTGHTNDNGPIEAAEEEEEPSSGQDEEKRVPQDLAGYSSRTKKTLANYDEYRIDYALIVKLLEQIAYLPDYRAFSQAILIFLPGIAEIRQLNDQLLSHPSFAHGWIVHALHSTFSSEEQQAAFEVPPPGIRKIVIATNIAETGITIPDITCVIDTGKHREMRFDERRQMSRLTQSFIARANAKQRRGRAGRVQEGICFHLFTKHRFENLMAEQQSPEMLRLSLQDLVMRVKICRLGPVESALNSALDPPSSKNVRRAIDALIEVGALTESEQLTSLGSQLAKLPLDAQLGKLILFGAAFGCLDFTLTVAATLTSKSPFLSPLNAKKQADSVRLGFKKGDSDLLTLYNAYCAWRKVCSTQGMSERHFCNKNFLSSQNLANIEDLKAQLMSALADSGSVDLTTAERTALSKVRPGYRQRNFVTVPAKYCRADTDDEFAASVVAWSFYPKIVKAESKGWRNIANNASLGLHPTSVNKHNISADIRYLSFYSIMQSSSKWTNAQETSPVSDFALVLLASEAVFHMYAGVIIIDGNRLRFKVRDWKTMIALKILRTKVREALGRMFKHPGRELGLKQKRWIDLVTQIYERRRALTSK